jgi:SAM-dependent methyltransferase
MATAMPKQQIRLPDEIELDIGRLNINLRSRTSRLPWRGQFSPELVEYFIDTICPDSEVILDPFCGSGTVLYEVASKGRRAVGLEVNPAAWHLAALAQFAFLPSNEKKDVLGCVSNIIFPAKSGSTDLFSTISPNGLLRAVKDESLHPLVRQALAAILVVGMGDNDEISIEAISRGGSSVLSVLRELVASSGAAECYLADARNVPLADESVDAIITSPPYINVFNYHHNYRSAVELLGWNPLEAARSELGANRKHRMNRFLTVIQYSMDMALCINDLLRVLRPDATAIIVVGRSSKVLGATFLNSAIILELLELSGGVVGVQVAERYFTNRYGEKIFEDILIIRRADKTRIPEQQAREVGIKMLKAARRTVPSANRETLEQAIAMAAKVCVSPPLQLTVPAAFAAHQAEGIAHYARYASR